jgi:hypothetical protein
MIRWLARDGTSTAQRRWAVPSWLASLVVHLAICLALAVVWQSRTSKGIAGSGIELTGTIGSGSQGDYYDDAEGDGEESGAQPASPNAVSVEMLLGGPPAVQPSIPLAGGPGTSSGPGGASSDANLFGPESGIGTGTTGAGRGSGSGKGSLVGGAGVGRPGYGRGTKTSFYVEDQGNSFVFAIDRSASMSQSGRMAAAKAELLGAIDKLDKTNQFQIIFFNDGMDVFRPQGDRAFFADEPTKRLAERFVRGITADGPTEGFARALRTAVSYHPDVIYFLTDAEDITMSDADLAALSRASYGTTIHAIKFGEGAEERIPWMVKLASQNSGKYLYVDTRGFAERR